MRNLLETFVLAGLLLAPAATANAQLSIRIGEPPPPRQYRVPPQPGPDYQWVEGYQYPEGNHYRWHDGYWTRAPYQGAYWVDPYHDGQRYYNGRWEGDRGWVDHDHRWDKSRGRDENHHPRDDDHRPR
jgi:hypothetical protein